MLNLLFRILVAVTAVILVLALIGSLLPRDYQTSASIEIQATPEQIFPLLEDLQRWQTWSPWNAHDSPSLQVEYGERTHGVGATQEWTEPRGRGKLWITEMDPPRSISFSSRFAGFPQMDSQIRLTGDDTGTRVRWTSRGSLPGGPFYGWFAFAITPAMETENTRSLEKLKAAVERRLATR